MANYTYKIDKSGGLKHDVKVLSEAGVVAATVSIIWPESRNQKVDEVVVGPYSVHEEFRRQALSYVLLWIGLTHAMKAGYSHMRTGLAHGPLHDTLAAAGLTPGESFADPQAGVTAHSPYLAGKNHPQNMGIVWHCADLAKSIALCETKMTAAGTTITKETADGGCCVIS